MKQAISRPGALRFGAALCSAAWLSVLLPACLAQQPSLSGLGAQPVSTPEPVRAAEEMEQANRFAEAEQTLRVYLRQDDSSGHAHELLGYALLREDKHKESLAEYTRAAALEKPSSMTLVHVGQAYALLNDNPDADRWTLRAVEMDPKNADAWYGLGRIRYTEQRFSDALSCFQRVLTLVPNSVKAENNLGLTYEALNQVDSAIAAYRQAIAWQNERPPAERSDQPLLNLGTVLVHQGQLAKAEPLLVEAANLSPKSPQVHEQLGHLFLQKRDYAGAQREFARACELDPAKSSLHFLLGQDCKRLGRKQEAETEFATAARLAHDEATPVSK
jgi:Flp pilus assembly protein TadD